jgi:hypothetical protein
MSKNGSFLISRMLENSFWSVGTKSVNNSKTSIDGRKFGGKGIRVVEFLVPSSA